jgi:hypothetical protein
MIDIILDQTGNDSSSKSEYYSRFKSAINYAKNKIAKERYAPDYSETVALTDSKFNTSSLSKSLVRIKSITDANGYDLSWERLSSTQIRVPNQTSVTVLYSYVPADLGAAADVLDFPLNVVDPLVLCYFASYQYFLAEGGNDDLVKSGFWISLWNDGFNSIQNNIGETEKVKAVYYI